MIKDLNNVKLIFSDVDETIAGVYTPATKNISKYLTNILRQNKSIILISGQGKNNIFERVVVEIDIDVRYRILIAECSGASIWGFDSKGLFLPHPYISFDSILSNFLRERWRDIIQEIINHFSLIVYPTMPKTEFRKISNHEPRAIMLDDRGIQITFEVVNSLSLREEILVEIEKKFIDESLPLTAVKAGTFAIDTTLIGVSKTTAVEYIINNLDILRKIGITDFPLNISDIIVWGDKFSIPNGGTDMNILYGLNKGIAAINFRKEPLDELDFSYNIKLWNGKNELHHGLEEYLSIYFGDETKIIHAQVENDFSYDIVFQDRFFEDRNGRIFDIIKENDFIVFYDEYYNLSTNNKFLKNIENIFCKNCLGLVPILTYKNNSEKKDFELLNEVLDILLSSTLSRRGIIIAIGGGALLDVIGLSAQLYRRSVSWIKIPTTLIGQIDAGIGIKVGINHKNNKNILGAFYPPKLVVNDFEFIFDLNETHIECGFAEIIKIAITSSSELIKLLINFNRSETLSGNTIKENLYYKQKIQEMIHLSCLTMINQLSDDFYEQKSLRRLVDFGHTFSSFIEDKSLYQINHGYAVSIDMIISIYISKNLKLISQEVFNMYIDIFHKFMIIKQTHIYFIEKFLFEIFDESIPRLVLHRGGNLNYVLPNNNFGQAGFINLNNCSDKSDNYLKVMEMNELRDIFLLSTKEMINNYFKDKQDDSYI